MLRSHPRVTLAYQDNSGDAYVALGGRANPIDNRSQMRGLWPDSVNGSFPEGFAEANRIVVRVDVDRIEIHARGITGEPFGHGRTLIARESPDVWRFIPAGNVIV